MEIFGKNVNFCYKYEENREILLKNSSICFTIKFYNNNISGKLGEYPIH